ncbi:uncharacterized protein LOC34618738 [Cyclospora cayetanensis]|uniref:Uncharacterized protein LOC34618738 n=1 Tax=Cyclospora cayetanensis TaxID=88456 RepID=A0A6P6RTC2_9EIME|nr:uncharacterized protein LOC34618738 [Cyclospora cayetanensis]
MRISDMNQQTAEDTTKKCNLHVAPPDVGPYRLTAPPAVAVSARSPASGLQCLRSNGLRKQQHAKKLRGCELEGLAFGARRCFHNSPSEHQECGQERQHQLLQDSEISANAGAPPLRLRRVVLLNKVTRFEVSLAEKMAAWRKEHLSHSNSSGTWRKVKGDEDPCEDPTLYVPGSRAFGAAAAAAEAAAAAALSRDFPSAYRTHVLHQQTAAEVYRQLREDYGLHVTVIKARTMQGLSITRKGAVAFPPDAVISAGGDGTYLEAASIIPGQTLGEPSGPWLFGVNTDPARSEGRLCVKAPFCTQARSDKLQQQQPEELQQQPRRAQQEELQQQYQRQEKNMHAQQQGCLAVGSNVRFWTPRAPDSESGAPSREAAKPRGAPSGAPGGEFDAKAYVAATLQHLLQGGARIVARQRIRATLRFAPHLQGEVAATIGRNQAEASASRGSGGVSTLEGLGPPRGSVGFSVNGCRSSSSRGSTDSTENVASGAVSCLGASLSESPHAESLASPGVCSAAAAAGSTFGGLTFDWGCPVTSQGVEMMEVRLPFLSVNDVLVSEANVAKTLYADVWIDGEVRRHKSSGVLISTGTGSSAWHFNMGSICKEQARAVADKLMRLRPQLGEGGSALTEEELGQVVAAANAELLLDPGAPFLRFLIREPIENRIFCCDRTMGVGKEVRVRPLAGEVIISMDGLAKLPLPPLVELVLSVHPGDALWTAE